jgi:hypothetical protein
VIKSDSKKRAHLLVGRAHTVYERGEKQNGSAIL